MVCFVVFVFVYLYWFGCGCIGLVVMFRFSFDLFGVLLGVCVFGIVCLWLVE